MPAMHIILLEREINRERERKKERERESMRGREQKMHDESKDILKLNSEGEGSINL